FGEAEEAGGSTTGAAEDGRRFAKGAQPGASAGAGAQEAVTADRLQVGAAPRTGVQAGQPDDRAGRAGDRSGKGGREPRQGEGAADHRGLQPPGAGREPPDPGGESEYAEGPAPGPTADRDLTAAAGGAASDRAHPGADPGRRGRGPHPSPAPPTAGW